MAKKTSPRKAPAKKSATKSAKSAIAKKPKKTIKTLKKPERKSAVKPASKTTASKTAAPPKAAAAPAKTAVATKAPATPNAAAPKKPTVAKKPPTLVSTGLPMIDTNLAAQTAAAMLLNRPTHEGASGTPAKESSTFKNLKEQIAHPKPTGLGNLFGPTGDQKKSGGHFSTHQDKGHNQTFGGLNKTGVPRRTNG